MSSLCAELEQNHLSGTFSPDFVAHSPNLDILGLSQKSEAQHTPTPLPALHGARSPGLALAPLRPCAKRTLTIHHWLGFFGFLRPWLFFFCV